MATPPPEPARAVLERILEVLASHRIHDFAFTGGVAVGVWAAPRQTRDVDLCGVLPEDEVERLLLLRDGIRSGPDALPDLVRFRVGDWDVDLFVSKGKYGRECLDGAVHAEIDGVAVRVVRAEDLLIHKLLKLRTDRRRLFQDLADIRAVISSQQGRLDWSYLHEWLPADEAALLEEAVAASDDELLRRLLSR